MAAMGWHFFLPLAADLHLRNTKVQRLRNTAAAMAGKELAESMFIMDIEIQENKASLGLVWTPMVAYKHQICAACTATGVLKALLDDCHVVGMGCNSREVGY